MSLGLDSRPYKSSDFFNNKKNNNPTGRGVNDFFKMVFGEDFNAEELQKEDGYIYIPYKEIIKSLEKYPDAVVDSKDEEFYQNGFKPSKISSAKIKDILKILNEDFHRSCEDKNPNSTWYTETTRNIRDYIFFFQECISIVDIEKIQELLTEIRSKTFNALN